MDVSVPEDHVETLLEFYLLVSDTIKDTTCPNLICVCMCGVLLGMEPRASLGKCSELYPHYPQFSFVSSIFTQ